MSQQNPPLTKGEINSLLRAMWQVKLVLHSSVELSEDKEAILQSVREYAFPINDPDDENDFAVIMVNSKPYFFSVDRLEEPAGSEDGEVHIQVTVGRVRDF